MLICSWLWVTLLGCETPEDSGTESGEVVGGACIVGPSISITSPASSSILPIGQAVSLTSEASSEVDSAANLRVLWAVAPNGGNTDNVGTGLNQTWTPEEAGVYRIFVQVEDSCTDDPELNIEPVQDSVAVEIEE